MSRRSLCVLLALAIVGGGFGGVLLLLLRYEPTYFRTAVVPAEERGKLSQEFLREFSEFLSALKSTDHPWCHRFTDGQINSFVQSGLAEKLLPEGISEPRVVFEAERMRLAFRYRNGLVNTVVSVSLRAWPSRTEANVLVLQLERLDAGLVPFSAQWLLERFAEAIRQDSIEVSWYRHDGYPVAVIRFQADQAHPTIQLRAIEFKDGAVTIHGRSNELQAATPPEKALRLADRR